MKASELTVQLRNVTAKARNCEQFVLLGHSTYHVTEGDGATPTYSATVDENSAVDAPPVDERVSLVEVLPDWILLVVVRRDLLVDDVSSGVSLST